MTKLKKLFQKAGTAATNLGQHERVSTIVAAFGNELQAHRALVGRLNDQQYDCGPATVGSPMAACNTIAG